MRPVALMGCFLSGCHNLPRSQVLRAINGAHFSSAVHRHRLPCTQSKPVFADAKRESLCVRKTNWGLCLTLNRSKGHSHWQNIRHTKGAAEAQKMKRVTYYIGLIKGAINVGGPNPDTNVTLAKVLQKMREENIPKANIKRYFENATKKAESSQTAYYEIRGPSGAVFILEIDSENPNVSKNSLKGLLKKTTGKVSPSKPVESLFERKGIVTVPVTKDMQVANMDEYLEIAIETGAEDVILTKNDDAEEGDTEHVLKFHCDPKTYTKVARDIEDNYNLEVSTYRVELFPHHWVAIESESHIEECTQIAEALQKHEEFVNLFDNISLPEDE